MLVRISLPGGGDPVDVVTTHLNSRRASDVPDERSNQAHDRQLACLTAFIRRFHDPRDALIVAGDFNAGQTQARRGDLIGQARSWSLGPRRQCLCGGGKAASAPVRRCAAVGAARPGLGIFRAGPGHRCRAAPDRGALRPCRRRQHVVGPCRLCRRLCAPAAARHHDLVKPTVHCRGRSGVYCGPSPSEKGLPKAKLSALQSNRLLPAMRMPQPPCSAADRHRPAHNRPSCGPAPDRS